MDSYSDTHKRLLDAATELFYQDGIAATAVDKVVSFSGISKPTLYVHFRSKDHLIAAVLERRHEERVSSLNNWVDEHAGSAREKLLAVFDWQDARHNGDAMRGCAFANAVAEIVDPNHPAREISRRHKRWMRDYLASLAADVKLQDPLEVGSDLMLLLDGANTRVLIEGDYNAAKDAKRLAAWIVEAHERSSDI